jgi:endonuclease G
MISRWEVVKSVAKRYGKLEEIFDDAERKLEQVRSGQLAISNLEDNEDRLKMRIAREKTAVPRALERINGMANFQDKYVLDKLSVMARSVCRILKKGDAIGTGFMIAEGLVITNHHVIEKAEDATDMYAEFDYELDVNEVLKRSALFKLDAGKFFLSSSVNEQASVKNSGLDFSIVGVSSTGTNGESLSAYSAVTLDGNPGKIVKGESCVIIQHPSGSPKKIVLKDTAFFSETGTRLVYESDTLPGSSGSMVVGLGTCEVIALHHSGLVRTDDQNRPLTRAGTLATEQTPEEELDWYANEGIRVSCITQAVAEAILPSEMEGMRNSILKKTKDVKKDLQAATPIASSSQSTSAFTTPPTMPSASSQIPTKLPTEKNKVQYFEVLLSRDRVLADDWRARAEPLVAGLLKRRRLISDGVDELSERLEYIEVSSSEDPWKLAEKIENLPQVESCTPDLEVYTDVGLAEESLRTERGLESAIYNDGTATVNEDDFKKQWANAEWYKKAVNMHKTYPNYHRQWNWLAVSCPEDDKRTKDHWVTIQNNLPKLRYVQLDTGYTRHSKSFGGYDLDKDHDFIDNDMDAEDRVNEFSDRFLLKFPSHGTRTASLTVGNKLSPDSDGLDGNSGILTFNGVNPARLIPYRIAKSVILIGRGEDMVNAASYAIQNSTDVMFMCMGAYPRPMFEVIAREAYKKGVIWVCAAGNEVELVIAPALYPGTIAVAAINPDDGPWKGSSNGKAVDIAAPGESVYVPFVDKNGKEIMVYGDGTSYATPHVASAAMLWKAKNLDEIKQKYNKPWQIVEAFRESVKKTARRGINWPPSHYQVYGAGILDIDALLAYPLPEVDQLTDAYEGVPEVDSKDLGIREAAHFIWNVIKRKLKKGPLESLEETSTLSERGQAALNAFTTSSKGPLESRSQVRALDADQLLRHFFNQ